jgi:hypothetical protein
MEKQGACQRSRQRTVFQKMGEISGLALVHVHVFDPDEKWLAVSLS